jgi:hypothetical protein
MNLALSILFLIDGPAACALLLATVFGDADVGGGSAGFFESNYRRREEARRRARPGRHARIGAR